MEQPVEIADLIGAATGVLVLGNLAPQKHRNDQRAAYPAADEWPQQALDTHGNDGVFEMADVHGVSRSIADLSIAAQLKRDAPIREWFISP